MSLKSKLDIKLINKLAKEESQLSQDLSVLDSNEPSLHDPLSKHEEHFEKKRLQAAGSYLDLQQIFAYLLLGLVSAWLLAVIIPSLARLSLFGAKITFFQGKIDF